MSETNYGEAEKQKTQLITLEEVDSDPEDLAFDNALIAHMASKADRIVARNLCKIIECIGINVINKCHAPSVRVLFEIAGRLNTKQPITPDEYRSFAETLAGVPRFADDSELADEEE